MFKFSCRSAGRLLLISTVLLPLMRANAGESVEGRQILLVGCHLSDNTCFATLDGPQFGGTLGCAVGATNEFRFENADTEPGKRAYGTLLASSLSGRRVTVFVEGCTGQGRPKLSYYNVLN